MPEARRQRTALALFTALSLGLVGCGTLSGPAGASPTLRTYVEPATGFQFLDHAVASATRTVALSMYELEDPTMEAELVARAHAGLDVRVLLDSAYEIKSANEPAARTLAQGGVHVSWAPSTQIFHAKYLIIDDATLFIGTANFTAQYYSSTRDFWIQDGTRDDVTAALATFSADFSHRSAPLSDGSGDLVWSPGSTGALTGVINLARRSLLVENEEMDSSTIESALEAAARRGVDVEVVMTYSSSWHSALSQLASAGVHVRVLSSHQVYIHAKAICADCSNDAGTVFVGSENFSTSSLDYNRELGLITTASSVVRPIEATLKADYAEGSTDF